MWVQSLVWELRFCILCSQKNFFFNLKKDGNQNLLKAIHLNLPGIFAVQKYLLSLFIYLLKCPLHLKSKEVTVLPCSQNYERKVDKQFITTFTAKNTFVWAFGGCYLQPVNNSQGVVGNPPGWSPVILWYFVILFPEVVAELSDLVLMNRIRPKWWWLETWS